MRVGIQVRDGRHEERHLPQTSQLLGRQHRTADLELERRDERDQVEVAAALAVPIDGALDVHASRAHRRQRVRHRKAAVVVRVNAERCTELRPDVAHPLLHYFRELPSVGVAQDDAVRAGASRRPQRGEGVVRVQAVVVEEVLCVVDHLPAEPPEVAHGIRDHAKILVAGRLEHALHVEGGALSDERDHRRLGLEQSGEAGIVLATAVRSPGHAEGGDPPIVEPFLTDPTEELRVLGVRARPAAFEVVDAQLVQPVRDFQLVVNRKRQALALRAVPQCRVVQKHVLRPSCGDNKSGAASRASREAAPRIIGSCSSSAECRCAASQKESDGNAGNRQAAATDAHTRDTNSRADCVNPTGSAPKSSRTRTTSPITTVAGGSSSSSATRVASVASVATTVRWAGSVPLAIAAAGVSGSAPCSSSRAVIFGKAEMPISTTSVGTRARDSQSRWDTPSHSCPVTTANADASRRSVRGIPAARGTAIADVTPGTTSNGTPATCSASHSSAPRPNTKGSPPLSRTTVRPRRARSTNNVLISSCARSALPPCERLPTNTRSAVGGASATKHGATRRSYTTTSADRRISRPLAVIRPGSPGPAPTKWTTPVSSSASELGARPCR